jgi:hypothetical protein
MIGTNNFFFFDKIGTNNITYTSYQLDIIISQINLMKTYVYCVVQNSSLISQLMDQNENGSFTIL